MGPGLGYTCGAAKVIKPTKYYTTDKRRVSQAMMTWRSTCTYSQFLAQKTPACCVSLSSFYNDTVVPCPTCSCGCQNNITHPGSCVEPKSPYLASVVSAGDKNLPLVRCTRHMCPIRIHWHVKLNYREYWRVKVTITNFDYRRNYSDWNLVVQHPNFDNLTQVFSFNSKSLTPYGNINDTAMLWGIKFYNDMLVHSGPLGNVQSELLFRKNPATFTFEKDWAFPRRIWRYMCNATARCLPLFAKCWFPRACPSAYSDHDFCIDCCIHSCSWLNSAHNASYLKCLRGLVDLMQATGFCAN